MVLEEYVEHLLAGEDEDCLAAAREIAGDLPGLHHLYVDLIQASQIRVGELWEAGKVSVASEHLATAINTAVAASCYAGLARAVSGGDKGMIACTPNESHELGARLLADLLECDGWDIDFYGPSMPVRDLIGAIQTRKPRFVGLSSALVMHLGSVKHTIAAIRETLGSEAPPIVVGGNAFRGSHDLWEAVGADLWARDAPEAVQVLSAYRT
jgi:methanogenic corrinoid protein MtbC1